MSQVANAKARAIQIKNFANSFLKIDASVKEDDVDAFMKSREQKNEFIKENIKGFQRLIEISKRNEIPSKEAFVDFITQNKEIESVSSLFTKFNERIISLKLSKQLQYGGRSAWDAFCEVCSSAYEWINEHVLESENGNVHNSKVKNTGFGSTFARVGGKKPSTSYTPTTRTVTWPHTKSEKTKYPNVKSTLRKVWESDKKKDHVKVKIDRAFEYIKIK